MSVVQETPVKEIPAEVQVIDKAIAALKAGDSGAHWEQDVIKAARQLLKDEPPLFQRKRTEIKNAHSDAQITEWTKEVKTAESGDEFESNADQLVELVQETAVLFHSPDGKCYATIEQDGHYETWCLDSKGFSDWMGYRAFRKFGKASSDYALKAALGTLTGIATYDGNEEEIYLRCAPWKDGYLIDLTNEKWQTIEVLPTGWKVVDESPVKFIRSQNATPLPVPTSNNGGNLDLLWKYVNVQKSDQTMVLAFMLDSWRPDTPYPILFLTGEQGSGKSTTHTVIRQLSDPNAVPLRTAPKSVEDIFVSAGVNHQVSFENMSRLSPEQQDALCTLATGGGFAKRTLYSDSDEFVIEVKRPVIINGIADVVTRTDLIDRTVHIELPKLNGFADERTFKSDYEHDRTSIFSGLLNIFVQVLKIMPDIVPNDEIRMTGYATLGEAVHKALGNEKSFSMLYKDNRSESLARSIESSPAAVAVLEMMRKTDGKTWTGTIKALKSQLDDGYHHTGEGWVKTPKGLSDVLRRMTSALRSMGVDVDFLGHMRDGSHVKISTHEGFMDRGVSDNSRGVLAGVIQLDEHRKNTNQDDMKVDDATDEEYLQSLLEA